MKKIVTLVVCFLLPLLKVAAQDVNTFYSTILFPGNYITGDYVEFVQVTPNDASAAGYYEVSISYTRGNIAASATHIVSASHANGNVWREAGRVNSNPYLGSQMSFTVDANTTYNNTRFRIRAIATYGLATDINVHVKIRAIGWNNGFADLNVRGNTTAPVGLLPMTAEWNLWVGDVYKTGTANIALKADINGNIGIGTLSPQSKLAVAGTITAQKVKVTATSWPDYVFKKDYALPSLKTVEEYVATYNHLPGIPAATVVEKEGQDLGDMNKLLLQKVEELTLYLINEHKKNEDLELQLQQIQRQLQTLKDEIHRK
ncbi:tail fiber protein [Chitinophaga sp. Cy-1792]|uniref:tail fiber protein n=1 Tax=Chitinophaga sp. Cy-1792 TaxID=2608339 RepID=UPI00141DCE10|nr:tail fiber protein [Chitinophaga sp. Cy-1792]NIG53464.1 hypothetical protein [Chitinophaga sp. Cy-1792]